jgi:hypothetical protein
VSVDNRYTGVGYEPPFETPSDKDFMAAHIETLESRVRELEAERDRLIKECQDALNYMVTLSATITSQATDIESIRARHAALVAAAREHYLYHKGELPADRYVPNSYIKIHNELKAALAEVKG